ERRGAGEEADATAQLGHAGPAHIVVEADAWLQHDLARGHFLRPEVRDDAGIVHRLVVEDRNVRPEAGGDVQLLVDRPLVLEIEAEGVGIEDRLAGDAAPAAAGDEIVLGDTVLEVVETIEAPDAERALRKE